jgi:hypothetical protein
LTLYRKSFLTSAIKVIPRVEEKLVEGEGCGYLQGKEFHSSWLKVILDSLE